MVREISSSSSESESNTSSSSLGHSVMTTYSVFTSDENERSVESEANEDPLQKWSEYCQCSTVYRGELDEKYCPNCEKIVAVDEEDNSSIDWDLLCRHFTVTKTSAASLENLVNAKFFTDQPEEPDDNEKKSIDEIDNESDDTCDAGLNEEAYLADNEDNAD